MKLQKAIKIALECMYAIRKQKHNQNRSGFHPSATIKELEIISAMDTLKGMMNDDPN